MASPLLEPKDVDSEPLVRLVALSQSGMPIHPYAVVHALIHSFMEEPSDPLRDAMEIMFDDIFDRPECDRRSRLHEPLILREAIKGALPLQMCQIETIIAESGPDDDLSRTVFQLLEETREHLPLRYEECYGRCLQAFASAAHGPAREHILWSLTSLCMDARDNDSDLAPDIVRMQQAVVHMAP